MSMLNVVIFFINEIEMIVSQVKGMVEFQLVHLLHVSTHF